MTYEELLAAYRDILYELEAAKATIADLKHKFELLGGEAAIERLKGG